VKADHLKRFRDNAFQSGKPHSAVNFLNSGMAADHHAESQAGHVFQFVAVEHELHVPVFDFFIQPVEERFGRVGVQSSGEFDDKDVVGSIKVIRVKMDHD